MKASWLNREAFILGVRGMDDAELDQGKQIFPHDPVLDQLSILDPIPVTLAQDEALFGVLPPTVEEAVTKTVRIARRKFRLEVMWSFFCTRLDELLSRRSGKQISVLHFKSNPNLYLGRIASCMHRVHELSLSWTCWDA